MILLFLIFVQVLLSHSTVVRYDDCQVYRIIPQTKDQLQTLQELQISSQGFDFWTNTYGIGHPIDVMVSRRLKATFDSVVDLHGLNANLYIENVQELIDSQLPSNKSGPHDFKKYGTFEQINDWLQSLPAKYPGKVEMIVGGSSYEGRKIVGVKVSFKSGNKAAFIEGGIHAREWISPATVTFILNEILSNQNPNVRKVVESRDWYVFPVTNPDGYVYSHTRERLWRKNRKPVGQCIGVDLNRNWGYKWNHGGVSHNPCHETYCGPSAFSEVETKSLSEYISTIASKLDTYLSFHSYSQMIMIPFGHDGREKPSNFNELMRFGKNAANALAKRYGTPYKVGNVAELMYVASGGSFDWVVGVHRNVRMPYGYELRDKGRHGFILPPDQIIPSGEETFDSVVSFIQQANETP